MGEQTHISWADHTFNPWEGCTRISNGPKGACEGCYAAHLVEARFGRAVFGGPGKGVGTRRRTSEANWRKPIQWDRAAKAAGTRPFVFCASLADVFDNAVDPAWRHDLFNLILCTPNLVWLLLTKRPQNIGPMVQESGCLTGDGRRFLPDNAALMCTVVTPDEAARDVPWLLLAKKHLNPAFVGLSMEPLMEGVDLTRLQTLRFRGAEVLNALTGELSGMFGDPAGYLPALDWVITGGETDQGPHKARPSHPDWFRSLRDQCAAAGVAYHHKQNGEWSADLDRAYATTARHRFSISAPHPAFEGISNFLVVAKIGKAAAGRELDGVVHDARPEVRHG